jgi:hypothetical protein
MRCKTCSVGFESKRARTFCSVKCRANDPEFKATLLLNLSMPKSRSGPLRAGETLPCIKCGAEIYLTATARKRGKKACSRSCWRAWLADRFDRAIATKATLSGVTGYDEFLSRDKLTCLVDGCQWEGADLALHTNLTHGIKAIDLKDAAGFNKSSGLISAPLAQLYEQRGNIGNTEGLIKHRQSAKASHPGASQKRRPESIEHYRKAMALRGAFRVDK